MGDAVECTVEAHTIGRADVIAFSLRVCNRSAKVVPAGTVFEIIGTKGAAVVYCNPLKLPDPLAPGGEAEIGCSHAMDASTWDMDFEVRRRP